MTEPLVSVVIPFYSGRTWLIEALESVVNQTYTDIEILVINDGSVEDISDIVMKYNKKVEFIRKENGGPASARNMGIEKSNGKYIAFLDSDDIWLEKKLEKQIASMEKKNSIWSQHSYEMFWEAKRKVKVVNTRNFKGDVYKDCFISFKIQTSCVVVKKEKLIQNNITFPINKRYGQDSAFYKQLASKYPLDYIDGVYSKFRIRGKNAGFRAEVQLSDRFSVWNEIRKNSVILKILPKTTILAYRVSSKAYLLYAKTSTRISNEKIKELYAKFLYIIPYTLFKLSVI